MGKMYTSGNNKTVPTFSIEQGMDVSIHYPACVLNSRARELEKLQILSHSRHVLLCSEQIIAASGILLWLLPLQTAGCPNKPREVYPSTT